MNFGCQNNPASKCLNKRNCWYQLMDFAAARKITCCAGRSHPSNHLKKVAVIGAGFAGLAVTYHLLKLGSQKGQISVVLHDAHGIGSGASGAAAGILHPCSPKGKVTWNGLEAMASAQKLIVAAQAAAVRRGDDRPVYWENGILRIAKNLKQAEGFSNLSSSPAQCISIAQAGELLPGVITPDWSKNDTGGIWIRDGIVVHPKRYMDALWYACRDVATTSNGSIVEFQLLCATSLNDLGAEYDAIVVAAGAATETIKELDGVIPMRLCQGYTLEMANAEEGRGEHQTRPNLLGSTYIGFQGLQRLVIGSTKHYGWNAVDSLQEVGRDRIGREECKEDVSFLEEEAGRLWRPSANWEVCRIMSGVRALTSMTNSGATPYAGRVVDELGNLLCWVATGLGARGVLYHSWLGELVAKATLLDDESILPAELRRWKL